MQTTSARDVLEKLGLDESDPMVRSMLYKGGMFNMAVPPSRHPLSQVTVALLVRAISQERSAPSLHPVPIPKSLPWQRS